MRVFAFITALAIPALLAGQDQAGEETSADYWFDVVYPKAFYSSRDGVAGGLFFAKVQPLRFEDFGSPPPYRATVGFMGQVSTRGSVLATVFGRFPQFVEGWRFLSTVTVRRDARDPYFGLGSATEYEPDSVTEGQPHLYQARQTRWSARLESQRYLTPHLRLLAGVDATHWKFSTLDGPSVLDDEVQNGSVVVTTEGTSDVAWRFGLVYDTRDNEVFAQSGILLQAIGSVADADVVGGSSYTRLMLSASGTVSPTERLSFAGRLYGQGMGGDPELGTLYVLDAMEEPIIGFGGGGSHRALVDNRYIGRHKLLANMDIRYAVYTIPTLVRVTAVGFFDVGRVFEGEAFRITTEDLQAGGGAGIFGHIGRSGVVGITGGVGPDGLTFDFHTRWPF